MLAFLLFIFGKIVIIRPHPILISVEIFMARVTVEDCIKNVKNRFELVILAAKRSRELSTGSEPTLAKDNDKNPVIALREIAKETISCANLRDSIVSSMQRHQLFDESEEDLDHSFQDALSEKGPSKKAPSLINERS
jgi:DNA-directed RNA polymerase subunit omega